MDWRKRKNCRRGTETQRKTKNEKEKKETKKERKREKGPGELWRIARPFQALLQLHLHCGSDAVHVNHAIVHHMAGEFDFHAEVGIRHDGILIVNRDHFFRF